MILPFIQDLVIVVVTSDSGLHGTVQPPSFNARTNPNGRMDGRKEEDEGG